MRNPTDLMKVILTSEKAQEIIDFVSPKYGKSYVGLWLFQAIGVVLGEVCTIADKLRYETNPATADLLLDYWEDHYGLPRDSSLTIDQRRARLVSRAQSHGPCNPVKLEAAISAALNGVKVEITENVSKNTFLVDIRDYVDDITPAVAVLERMKPAHLIYQIRVAMRTVSTAEIKTAIAITYAEKHKVEVTQ